MQKIVVTGGAGFVGSHSVRYLAMRYPRAKLIVVDALTYAGDLSRIQSLLDAQRIEFEQADICDRAAMEQIFAGADMVVHFAAESHVDRSFDDPMLFHMTNATGTQTVLDAARKMNVDRFIHISTDEVYGTNAYGLNGAKPAKETTGFAPTNPYSVSKAAADLAAQSYASAFGMDVRILRPNNIFGTHQNDEKLIPCFARRIAEGKPLIVHGGGLQRRCFLHVSDFCNALGTVIDKGKRGGIYNVGGAQRLSIRAVAHHFANLSTNGSARVISAQGRPINDVDYVTDDSALRALGWHPTIRLTQALPELALWYMRDKPLPSAA